MDQLAITRPGGMAALLPPIESQVHVAELVRSMRARRQRQVAAFAVVLERCYRRIRRCASVNRDDCVCDVPPVVEGHPPFDVDACVAFVARHLGGNGFAVRRIGLRELHVSWDLGESSAGVVAASQQQQQPQSPQSTIQSSSPPPLLQLTGPPRAPAFVRHISDFRPNNKLVLTL